jgi:hypothetical protein
MRPGCSLALALRPLVPSSRVQAGGRVNLCLVPLCVTAVADRVMASISPAFQASTASFARCARSSRRFFRASAGRSMRMQKPLAVLSRCAVLLVCELLLPPSRMPAQSAPSLADLRWSANETPTGRFTIVPGRRAFVAGYNGSGLEAWTQPLLRSAPYSERVGWITERAPR